MPGGVFEIIGLLALLVGVVELMVWLVGPEPVRDQMIDIVGDHPAPLAEPEVRQLREKGAL